MFRRTGDLGNLCLLFMWISLLTRVLSDIEERASVVINE